MGGESRLILQQTTKLTKRSRVPHVSTVKLPLQAETYYTPRELTDKSSPFYQFSQATLFRYLPQLNPRYVGRKLLIKGSSLLALIEGNEEGE